jgi:transcriptional regulator with XRE-family HTH domain
MTIGGRIKQLRCEQGLSQYDFGRKIGQSPQVISKYEKGKMFPHVKTMAKMIRVFHLDPGYFFADDYNYSDNKKEPVSA